MCERLDQKQASLEAVLSEKAAADARLEAEMARTRELQREVGAWHGPQITDSESLLPLRAHSRRQNTRSWTAEFNHVIASRDPIAAWALIDEVVQRSSVAISQDGTVRALVVGYLLLLQFSAFTVLIHALLGKHHH
eukprot:CAMPEP_0114123180 /NCGR_PEP_ID=MMETSP0043_2-20121206/8086_1 /TAXON_ID=464988 /ORGANISM="Hemiselmis andersenii, Strain CCMP644" /LENGTH=135 /DNA_ID=CAMNT_0001215935 /DNA_START=1 /DNA_END=408 /DNA_ORIENTATION=+